MLTHLFRFLLLVGLIAPSLSCYGQDSTSVEPPRPQLLEPIYIVNPNIIMGGKVFSGLNPHEILQILIHKGNNAPPLLTGVSSVGVVSFDYRKRIPSQSFAQVARRQGVRQPFRVVLNGRPLSIEQVTALRIASGAIGKVCVTPATSDTSEAILTIQLAEAKPVKHPPGSIFVR